jgi:hypothetical protein
VYLVKLSSHCILQQRRLGLSVDLLFNLLNDAVANGGTENMLTGADRSKTLWALNDKLSAFQKKLNKLYLSIRYYTMSDVWNNVTAGMIDRSNGEIATQALGRWRRAAKVGTP